ncbi:tetratricopeptide repeat protein [Peptostreptococcus russellii]|uniref:tetratricopeptide repeat protein n=1 Tax=Peptostreptococcus russellii TaxID=215200 RepID=UPI0026F09535|nr:hypothetical protein [Peptostreptococcus russellii]
MSIIVFDRDNKISINEICKETKKLINQKKYLESEKIVLMAMVLYPHSPEPHNLMGILLERQGKHLLGMKHFRAAWELDPNYEPAKHNLEHYGTFLSLTHCAFDETDCGLQLRKNNYQGSKKEAKTVDNENILDKNNTVKNN